MQFTTLAYAKFLVLAFVVTWLFSQARRLRLLFLLGASYFFYAQSGVRFLALIFACSTADFLLSHAIGRASEPAVRKRWLVLTVVMNLGVLGFFKYLHFGVDNAQAALAALGVHLPRLALSITLPVGISFFTFESMSYVIDVYRGDIEPHESYLEYLTFVAFFPHLVAGPIVRPRDLLPQLARAPQWDEREASKALLLIATGLLKKLAIADYLGLNLVDRVFDAPTQYSALECYVAVVAYAVQIYTDFSGYTDIAIGSAALLGVRFPANFAAPYQAFDIVDFWRRWHISLSSWFRDYVYIPLGGNRGSKPRLYFNVFLTFLLSGFWHGASWNYVMWGAYHGLLLVIFRALEEFMPSVFRARWLRPVRIIGMFALVNLGWLMFRETNIHQLLRDLQLRPSADSSAQRLAAAHFIGLIVFYSIPLWLDSALYLSRTYQRARATLVWAMMEGAAAVALIAAIALFYSEVPSDFIYFQF